MPTGGDAGNSDLPLMTNVGRGGGWAAIPDPSLSSWDAVPVASSRAGIIREAVARSRASHRSALRATTRGRASEGLA